MIARAITTVGSFSAYEYAENDEKRSYGAKYNLSEGTLKEQWDEMSMIANMNVNIRRKKYVNALISFDKSQNPEKLSNKDLRNIAETYAKEIGFYDNQWKFAIHTNTDEPHIHFFANRIGFDGKNKVRASNIGKRSGQIVDKIAKSFGFKTSKEISKERKSLALQYLLKSVNNCTNWKELKNDMLENGYHFILSENKNGVNGVNGARVIPIKFYKSPDELSEREKYSKKGYKLSDLSRKYKIKDIEKILQENLNKKEVLTYQKENKISTKKFKI